MKVKILLAIPDERSYGPCTMVLDTIRVGYPNSEVEVWLNPTGPGDLLAQAGNRAKEKDCVTILHIGPPLHHAEWIKALVEGHARRREDGPLIIVDGDVMFHSSCEDWKFDQFLAGYFVPEMYNDFSQCKSYS